MGDLVDQVRADIASLGELVAPMAESRAKLAIKLAEQVEDPDEKNRAACANQLRAVLTELAGAGGDDDDLDGTLSAPS